MCNLTANYCILAPTCSTVLSRWQLVIEYKFANYGGATAAVYVDGIRDKWTERSIERELCSSLNNSTPIYRTELGLVSKEAHRPCAAQLLSDSIQVDTVSNQSCSQGIVSICHHLAARSHFRLLELAANCALCFVSGVSSVGPFLVDWICKFGKCSENKLRSISVCQFFYILIGGGGECRN